MARKLKNLTPKNDAKGVRTYLIFSAVVGIGVGIIWFAGIRDWIGSFVAAGLAFIVSLIIVATLALTVKDDAHDPDEPRLK
ncbi:MAG: hypothetical protein RL102_419 [Actinomycetota bacterium]|jgi:divalent metal cation (Fe/Co/Zn/Cd) transporter